ncbi:L-2-amino-thiazoline-4-carboxylic acid hydrolase [Rhodospirillum sp. A1_3_36]|uniref:L-2-amino-thiazoline-4-carboxylic acid hydrolase n=1 Tax=Rhodospirillum sp. A1_3_36 TaxID=3391666 RepID=UPI0039A5069D
MGNDISILEQRRIEAAFAKGIYDEMAARLGVDTAREILGAAVARMATAHGQSLADKVTEEGKPLDMETFGGLQSLWTRGGALETTTREQTEEVLRFDVTRCRYAEMYREMGVAEIGDLLSCRRDATMIVGFNPEAQLERTQTIMGGADHCDFCYSLKK